MSCRFIGFGVLVLIRGVRRDGAALGGFALKQSVKVLSSIVAFAFLMPRAGLIIALLVLIFGSSCWKRASLRMA